MARTELISPHAHSERIVWRPRRDEFERLCLLETNECIEWTHSTAYGYGQIWIDGKLRRASGVVLERRVGPRPSGAHAAHAPIVCHNRSCINYRHLRWATTAENQADIEIDGTRPRGEQHPNAKLTHELAAQIRALYPQHTLKELAARFGFALSTIQTVTSGKRWN